MRHPMDSEKSNRALGFPALITGLYQFYGVPVAPSKVIWSPITRAFIEKYYTPSRRRARHHSSLETASRRQPMHHHHPRSPPQLTYGG